MSEVITTACSEIGDDKKFFEKNELYSYTAHMCYQGYLAMILPIVLRIMICHDLEKGTMI